MVSLGTDVFSEEIIMPDDIPSPRQRVRDQVDHYEKSGGREGTPLREVKDDAERTRLWKIAVAEPKR